MFAAIEIHNKPIFKYRYEVCTLLVVNAWELALKSYIAKELKSVKLVKKDGTTKPFPECVACVASKLGKPFEPTKQNLEILYEYRNKVAHFYASELVATKRWTSKRILTELQQTWFHASNTGDMSKMELGLRQRA